MPSKTTASTAGNNTTIKWLTCLMFMMFAMTSDAVGSVIPQLIKEFGLSLTAAGTFHYVPMAAIALGAILLGFMADRFGRQATIIVGLVLYGVSSALFAFGSHFAYFVALLAISGFGVSIFKTGALALVGDITKSANEHSSLMNTVEGFFATGAIIGPAIVATLLATGFSWKWLYVAAAMICAVLIVVSLMVKYPHKTVTQAPASLSRTLKMGRDPYALAFSTLIMLYVAVEVAIYVWMPTYLADYHGSWVWLPVYALSIFFVLRAAGRFLGAWLIRFVPWTWLLAVFGAAIFACFAGALVGGTTAGAFLLPASGLFMSVIYPTLNSKGISCFPKSEHGAAAGLILFFTAVSAAAAPLAMGAVSDAFGGVQFGFWLATGFSALLFAGLFVNLIYNPAKRRLAELERVNAEADANSTEA
jgi:MFS transporter, DHA1 family, quinolone resistance protein